MSREYASLQATSILPSWVEGEEILAKYWLLQMGGTHADEEGQVEYVQSLMAAGNLPDGVLPIIANRRAVEQGVRSIAPQQLMGWYPGRFAWQADHPLTNEELTAAGITWLANHLHPEHILIDRHENKGRSRYMAVGQRIPPAALAAGHIMGQTTVQITPWTKFMRTTPRAMLVEDTVPTDPEAKARYYVQATQQLAYIASLGISGLTEYYHDCKVAQQLTYYENVREVCLLNERTHEPDPAVLSVLPELESIDAPPLYGAEITLSDTALAALGLRTGRRYYWTGRPYDNLSPTLDNARIGKIDGLQRQLAWNEILADRRPPVQEKGSPYLTFGVDHDKFA